MSAGPWTVVGGSPCPQDDPRGVPTKGPRDPGHRHHSLNPSASLPLRSAPSTGLGPEGPGKASGDRLDPSRGSKVVGVKTSVAGDGPRAASVSKVRWVKRQVRVSSKGESAEGVERVVSSVSGEWRPCVLDPRWGRRFRSVRGTPRGIPPLSGPCGRSPIPSGTGPSPIQTGCPRC